jgi:hypothetical protein
LFSFRFAMSEPPDGKQPGATDNHTAEQPVKQQGPELRLHVAGRQNMGEARGFSLAVEVTNSGTQTLQYFGYRADSFAPPIPKGEMRPMYRVELKKAGKWQADPIGWCGTGMDALDFAPKTSATFGDWVSAGSWEAVRIGISWRPKRSDKEAAWTVAWSPELAREEIRRALPSVSIAEDPQRPAKSYTLKHADPDRTAALLRSMFIVVNPQQPYVRFEVAEGGGTVGLAVSASPEHQAQIARVLSLLDVVDSAPAKPAADNKLEPQIDVYPIKHADGDAAAGVLRSLFLVVNYESAYARIGYDARTRSLIAIASQEHQKQIAKVIELLDDPAAAVKDGASDSNEVQPVRVYYVRHDAGEPLVAKLRSQFVVVNHEKAETRFAFDSRTDRLFVIADGKLQAKIGAEITALNR